MSAGVLPLWQCRGAPAGLWGERDPQGSSLWGWGGLSWTYAAAVDSVCPCPWSTAGFGLLPCPAGVTLQHPPSFGAGYCSHGRCECVGAQCPLPGPGVGLSEPLPGRSMCCSGARPLRTRLWEWPRPAPALSAPPTFPSAGALRAARGRCGRRWLPAPPAIFRSLSAAAADMVSPGPTIRRHPRGGPAPPR